jgi:hypothetical protein
MRDLAAILVISGAYIVGFWLMVGLTISIETTRVLRVISRRLWSRG